MNKLVSFIFLGVLFLGCEKTPISLENTPSDTTPTDTIPSVTKSILVLNEYDAAYHSNDGTTFYTYAYHVKDTMYYSDGLTARWSTLIYNAKDTLYYAHGKADSSFGLNKGCVALVSSIDPSQQVNNNYIGSYYKFSLFNDTAVGNVQFMVPADGFPSIDSIPVGVAFLNFHGGINSFYTGMAKSEVKVTPQKNFVKSGDSFSYANPVLPAQGSIDSADVHLLIRRFSDNGIHPNSKVTRTMDGHFFLKFYFHDGSYFSIVNGEFSNIFFQKAPL